MRWRILAILFIARTAMAVQYQSIAALSPVVQDRFGIGLAEIGFLIGLYFLPGMAVALPGSGLARRFGDRRVVSVALLLMVAGGLVIAFVPDWGPQSAARVAAGVGGVLLNVLMTKMVTDWFAGREIGTAMALFINSWPFGIALALVVLPSAELATGFSGAMGGLAGVCALAFLLVALGYRPPPGQPAGGSAGTWPRGRALACLGLAGCVWGLFNVAIAAVFAFGPEVLVARGMTLQGATAQVSIVLWALAVAAPFGGILLDRIGRRDLLIATGCVIFALALAGLWVWPAAWVIFVVIGLASGLSAGPIMTMPADVLPPEARAVGMGLFFTIYYLLMSAGPALLGLWAEASGREETAFLGGLGALALTLLTLVAFRRLRAD